MRFSARPKPVAAVLAAAALTVMAAACWYQGRGVTLGLSREGCAAVRALDLPTASGEGGAACRLEHVNVSPASLLDSYMYDLAAEDGSYEVSVQKRLVVWTERGGERHFTH